MTAERLEQAIAPLSPAAQADVRQVVAELRAEHAAALRHIEVQAAAQVRYEAAARSRVDDAVRLASVLAARLARLEQATLALHWKTTEVWGGVERDACGRCRYGDGVRYLWPCPGRRAVTGEAAPETLGDRVDA